MSVNCTILPNGDLLVTADNETRSEIAHGERQRYGYWSILSDLFEAYSSNGSFTPFDAGQGNPFVGLTSAPCIAEAMIYPDCGDLEIDGRCWWFPDYMIADPLEQLKMRGRTIFTLAT